MKLKFLWKQTRNSYETDSSFSIFGHAIVMVYTGIAYGPWFLGLTTAFKVVE